MPLQKGESSFHIKASKPDIVIPIYQKTIEQLSIDLGKEIQTGILVQI
jgi:D-tyrosyl-tRNA(Tyr) deacylase